MKKITVIGLLIIGLIFQNCKDKQTESKTIIKENTETVLPQETEKTSISDTITTPTNINIAIESEEITKEIDVKASTVEKIIIEEVIEKENEVTEIKDDITIEEVIETEVVKETIEKTEQIIEKTVEIKEELKEVNEEIIEKTEQIIEKEKEVEKVIKESVKNVEETVSLNDWVVPNKYQKMTNPEDASKENIAIGKTLYAKHCKSCHGKEGYGDGPKADEVEGELGDFSSEDFQAQSDGALFYKSYIGRDDMPNYEKKMDEEDMWLVVHYMRKLAE